MIAQEKVSVLIADDNPNNLVTLDAALENLGYELVKVSSGEGALRCLLRQEFALVLLDVNMPGMNGYKTASLIRSREKTAHLPIIFITAGGPGEINVMEGYSLGAVDYIFSPIVPEILRAKVSVFVDLFKKTEEVKKQAKLLREAEHKEYENALLQKEKEREQRIAELMTQKANELERSNEELRCFAHVASHDLQEPLRMVTSYMNLLQQRCEGKLDSESEEFIRFAVDGAKRMRALIKGLLDYSRVGADEKDELKRVEANEIFDAVKANLHERIAESSAQVSRGNLPAVFANATQLTQLLQNLIENALKYRSSAPPVIRLEATVRDGDWLFSVRDNGIGIDPQYNDLIFVIFQRLHARDEYSGTGMGLAICKKIVEHHGGKIWVESVLGKGATFYFTIRNEVKR